MQKWQHCKLQGNRVEYLGAAGVFDNKRYSHLTARAAFSKLENDGWQLVNVQPDPQKEGEWIYFFKRLLSGEPPVPASTAPVPPSPIQPA